MKIHSLCTWLRESTFVRNVAGTLATRFFLLAIGLVTSVLVARILGPEGRGLYAITFVVGAIGIQFGNLGLHAANVYYVSRDPKSLPGLLGNSFAVSFIMGVCMIIGVGLWSGHVTQLLLFSTWLLMLALAWIPFGLFYLFLQNLLLGLKQIRFFNGIELTMKIVTVILIGVLIIRKAVTVERVFLMSLITLIFSNIWALIVLKPFLTEAPRVSFSLFKRHFRYGLKAYIAAFFGYLVGRLDLLLVQYMMGSEQSGYYSVSVNMADVLYTVPLVIGTILFPRLAAVSDASERWRLAHKTTIVTLVIMIPLVFVALIFAEPLITILFGRAFLPAVTPFRVIGGSMIMYGAAGILSNYLASDGLPPFLIVIWIMATVLNIILNLILIPTHGILGAAWASFICYGGIFVVQYGYALIRSERRYLKV
ncbi:MAG: oligosaccharide flippase family protein [Elusimicrobia bacterium]|nr:oligosaccharide flippase family protein [Candidatus Obscuribacterium magneticum]